MRRPHLTPRDIPPGLRAAASRSEEWGSWIGGLPRLVNELLEEWQLTVDGPAMHGFTAIVVPTLGDGEEPTVLKVGFPGPEERHEILGLRTWGGRGAVRLLRGGPRRGAMELERLGPGDLHEVDDLEACEVVAHLYGRLHVPAPPQLDPITRWVGEWADDLAATSGPVPRRLVDQAVRLARAFVDDPASVGTLVHTDLHHENVLRSVGDGADREPWLVIDPKPMSGDPHYELAPMLFNRWEHVIASGDVRGAVRRRFHTLVDAAGLDEHRARDWVVVREAINAMWAVEDDEPDDVTMHLAVAKAVQD